MSSSDNYKRQIMSDLASGDREMMPETSAEEYENFDDFAQRTSPAQRKQLFGRSLNHDSLPPAQIERLAASRCQMGSISCPMPNSQRLNVG